jgi:hypothetical protein
LWNACRIYAGRNPFIDRKESIDLDDFGFPVISLANRLLIQQADFGESRESLEKSWQKWLNHEPFDAPVARRLAEIYRQDLARIDAKTDSNAVQRLERKLRRTEARAQRYGKIQSN